MLSAFLMLVASQQPLANLNVEYARYGSTALQMDIYSPSKETSTPRPAVVVIHGGAWIAGKRQDMRDLAVGFAKDGLVAATVSYRLAPKFKWPAMLDDVQAAVRYLRANASKLNIDPTRIGAAGASAGGHLAVFLGVRETRDKYTAFSPRESSRVSVVLDLFGPVDLASPDFPATLDPVFALILGKSRKNAATEIRDASPIHFVDEKAAPVFIYQGLADPLVPANQSKLLEKRYKELGLTVEARYIADVGHEVKADNPDSLKALREGLDFVKKHLTEAP